MPILCRECLLGVRPSLRLTRSYAAAKGGNVQKKAQGQKGKPGSGSVKRSGAVSSSYSRNRMPAGGQADDRMVGRGSGGGGARSGLNIGPLNPEWFRSAPTLNGLQEMQPDDHLRPSSVGHTRLFSKSFERALTIFGAPESVSRQFALTARPASILRNSTMRVMDALDLACARPREKNDDGSQETEGDASRMPRYAERKGTMTLVGASGSGKSYTALQAVNYAISQDWLVYYHPNVTEWVNSSYAYRPASTGGDLASTLYIQDSLALSILKKFYDFNAKRLDQIAVPKDMSDKRTSGTTLAASIRPWVSTNALDVEKGAQDMLRWVLDVIRSQAEIPLLLSLDGVNGFFRDSLYNSEIGVPIPAPNLGVPRLFLEYMTGRKTLSSGLALSAVSASLPPPFSNTPELLDALYPDTTLSAKQRALSHRPLYTGLGALLRPGRMHLSALNMREARGLYGLLIDSGCTGTKATEESFLKVLSESTGNPKLFTKAAFTQGLGL